MNKITGKTDKQQRIVFEIVNENLFISKWWICFLSPKKGFLEFFSTKKHAHASPIIGLKFLDLAILLCVSAQITNVFLTNPDLIKE